MCSVNSKKQKFIKKQEARLLSSAGIRIPFSQIHLLGRLLFQKYKVNETISKFLLAVDKFMPEMHL